jgi:hypothetical protein
LYRRLLLLLKYLPVGFAIGIKATVFSRPLEGEAPTIDVAVGYSKSNTSPILKLFLSRLDELTR